MSNATAMWVGTATEWMISWWDWFFPGQTKANKDIKLLAIKTPTGKHATTIDDEIDHLEIKLQGIDGYRIAIPLLNGRKQRNQERDHPFLTVAFVEYKDKSTVDITQHIKRYAGFNGDFYWHIGVDPPKVGWVLPQNCKRDFAKLIVAYSNGEMFEYEGVNDYIDYGKAIVEF
jgi:hypothetical protein